MEVTINYNGQAVTVEVTLEVYEFLDRADHKAENKKAAAEAKAMEEAKKSEAEDVLKKLLASGMSADEIVAKLQ